MAEFVTPSQWHDTLAGTTERLERTVSEGGRVINGEYHPLEAAVDQTHPGPLSPAQASILEFYGAAPEPVLAARDEAIHPGQLPFPGVTREDHVDALPPLTFAAGNDFSKIVTQTLRGIDMATPNKVYLERLAQLEKELAISKADAEAKREEAGRRSVTLAEYLLIEVPRQVVHTGVSMVNKVRQGLAAPSHDNRLETLRSNDPLLSAAALEMSVMQSYADLVDNGDLLLRAADTHTREVAHGRFLDSLQQFETVMGQLDGALRDPNGLGASPACAEIKERLTDFVNQLYDAGNPLAELSERFKELPSVGESLSAQMDALRDQVKELAETISRAVARMVQGVTQALGRGR